MVDNMTDNQLNVLVSKCFGYKRGMFSPVNKDNSILRLLGIMSTKGYAWNVHRQDDVYDVWFCRKEWETNELAQARVLPYGKSEYLWRAVVFAVLNVFGV